MIERIRSIIFSPHQAWQEIKQESSSFTTILIHYVLPLAAIPSVSGMFGYSLVGMRSGFSHVIYRIPLHMAFVWAVIYYISILVGLYVQGVIINALAPSFDSKHNRLNAYKLVVYAYTPAFLAGIINIIPALGILVILFALYGIYLLYIGLPIMMDTPTEKVVGYLVFIIIIVIITYIVIETISGVILSAGWRPVP